MRIPRPLISEAAFGVKGGVVGVGSSSMCVDRDAAWALVVALFELEAGAGLGDSAFCFEDAVAALCATGSRGCVQCRPWFTQSLQKPQAPSLQKSHFQ